MLDFQEPMEETFYRRLIARKEELEHVKQDFCNKKKISEFVSLSHEM